MLKLLALAEKDIAEERVDGETIYVAYIMDCRQDLQKLVDTLVLMP